MMSTNIEAIFPDPMSVAGTEGGKETGEVVPVERAVAFRENQSRSRSGGKHQEKGQAVTFSFLDLTGKKAKK